MPQNTTGVPNKDVLFISPSGNTTVKTNAQGSANLKVTATAPGPLAVEAVFFNDKSFNTQRESAEVEVTQVRCVLALVSPAGTRASYVQPSLLHWEQMLLVLVLQLPKLQQHCTLPPVLCRCQPPMSLTLSVTADGTVGGSREATIATGGPFRVLVTASRGSVPVKDALAALQVPVGDMSDINCKNFAGGMRTNATGQAEFDCTISDTIRSTQLELTASATVKQGSGADATEEVANTAEAYRINLEQVCQLHWAARCWQRVPATADVRSMPATHQASCSATAPLTAAAACRLPHGHACNTIGPLYDEDQRRQQRVRPVGACQHRFCVPARLAGCVDNHRAEQQRRQHQEQARAGVASPAESLRTA